jgi:hypothetical protein
MLFSFCWRSRTHVFLTVAGPRSGPEEHLPDQHARARRTVAVRELTRNSRTPDSGDLASSLVTGQRR